MSIRAMVWAFDQEGLESGLKFVLVALADKADDANSCYPGQAMLARMTGQSERSVRSHVAELEGLGLLTRQHRYRTAPTGRGGRTSDRYVLAVDGPIPAAVAGTQTTTEHAGYRQSEGGLPANPAGVTGNGGRGTVREPSEEPTDVHTGNGDRKPKTPRRATVMPDIFPVTDAMRRWAKERHITADLDRETEKWRNHHTAKGSTMKDWVACWRTWMLNSIDFGRGRAAPAGNANEREWWNN